MDKITHESLEENGIKEKECLLCGKKILARTSRKRFCSTKCAFRNWRTVNREHFNDLIREKSKIHMRELAKERRDKGVCVLCGNQKVENKSLCEKCLIRNRGYYWKKKKIMEGEKNEV